MLLGDSTEVSVITSNRDLGAAHAYEDLPTNSWVAWRNQASVLYCDGAVARMRAVVTVLRSQPTATLYLNSMFSLAGALWPLLWVRMTRASCRVVLAPRGMLKGSALSQKQWKKIPLLRLMRLLGLVKRVTFHATSEDEIQEIKDAFGDVRTMMISNVPTMPLADLPDRSFTPGTARLCLVGRVHPIKNVLWLLEVMKTVVSPCHLTIVGPIEDKVYHQLCQVAVDKLPKHVSVEFVGPMPEKRLTQILVDSDAMVLPTQGENFGHAIFESFAVGTPVVISDRTIWRDLEGKHAGWDLSLGNPSGFVAAIDGLASMSEEKHAKLRRGAMKVAADFVDQNEFEEQYQRLFFGKISMQQ